MTDLNGNIAVTFERIEQMVRELKSELESRRAAPTEQIDDKVRRVMWIKELLAAKGSLTTAEIQAEIKGSYTTATRLMHQLARDKAGIIVLEPTGPTYRMRIWHPDRVILDAGN